MSSKQTRVAVLFYRVGPYHFARLRAAGQQMRVTVVEYSNVDPFYAWDEVAGQEGFERVTLFNGVPVEQQSAERVAARVRTVLSELRPEVVAVPGWHDRCALVALKWCCDEAVPTVVMSDTTQWDYERKWWKEAVKRRIVGLCSAALVAGRPHKDYMVKLGMPEERVFPGYDAVDNEYFKKKAEMLKEESRNKYGLPEKYFLASARFVEKKNLPRLIEAYARYRALARRSEIEDRSLESVGENVEIRKQPGEVGTGLHGPGKVENQNKFQLSAFSPWSLVLLGDGPLRSSIYNLRSSLGLDDSVLLPGFKQYPDLPAYYGLAKAFIHASTTEQWGLVVNEAMASGLPVLVSNRCGCAMDLVKDGVNGFTFDPCNVEALAQLMLKISLRGVGPSGPEAAFNFPLSEFGSESHRIISNWGPERFASGLEQAVECALRVGPVKPTLPQRMILKAMLRR